MDHEFNNKHDQDMTEIFKPDWIDLPQDILGRFVLPKLCLADRIRFRAVCKNWCVPEDDVIKSCSDWIPWAVTLASDALSCELFDPHSQLVSYKVRNPAAKLLNPVGKFDYATVHASKYGWLLIGNTYFSLILHNPFKNEVICLPDLKYCCRRATFTTNPKSQDSEVVVFMIPDDYGQCTLISRYRLSTDTEWSTENLVCDSQLIPSSLHYMNGVIYCYFGSLASLKSYNMVDKSWQSLHQGNPRESVLWKEWNTYWLTEKDGYLILALCGTHFPCHQYFTVFSYDLSKMCLGRPDLDGTAIFVDKNVIMLRPLVDENGNNLAADCRVLFLDTNYMFRCFSLRRHKEIEEYNYDSSEKREHEYSWITPVRLLDSLVSQQRKHPWFSQISFIQPPRF